MSDFSVLTLDLATVTGWAVYSKRMDRPFSGHIQLPPKPELIGPACSVLWAFLLEKHKMHQFTHICFEAQHIAQRKPKMGKGGKMNKGGVNMKVVYKLIGLGALVEFFCDQADIHCYDMPIATWRKHFLGVGTGMTRAMAKEMCLRQCEALGWHTIDDNAAEACGIMDTFLTRLPDEYRPWRDRTLMGAHKQK